MLFISLQAAKAPIKEEAWSAQQQYKAYWSSEVGGS